MFIEVLYVSLAQFLQASMNKNTFLPQSKQPSKNRGNTVNTKD